VEVEGMDRQKERRKTDRARKGEMKMKERT
jgi:hypothetical protein